MQSSQTGAKKALSVVASIALAFAGTVGISSAAHAADAHPVFISFETGDAGGAVAASPSGPFGGPSTSIADSSHLTGKALQFVKSGEPWGGVNLLLADTSAYKYADADHKVITLDYWSNDTVASPVMLKLTAGGSAVMKAVEAQPGLNHLSFDMSTGTGWDATKEYNLVTLFPDFGADDGTYTGAAAIDRTGQTYEIDNVSFNGGVAADILAAPVAKVAHALYVSFEADDTLAGIGASGDGPFGGASASVAASTHLSGKSLQFVKSGEVWGGVNLLIAGSTAYKITDSTHKVITLDYWSNDTVASPVMMKLTSSSGTAMKSLEAAPGLNHLSFDMSTGTGWDASKEYTVVTVFPDFGADDSTYTGAASIARTGQVYEIDNVSFNGGTIADVAATPPAPRTATSTLLTFESSDALGALVVGAAAGDKPQGAFEGAETSIADAIAGGNGGKALKIIKKTGSQVYAGVNVLKFAADTKVTDSGHKILTFNYYSPKDASPTRVEIVPYPHALGMTINAVKGWQTLTFDLGTVTGDGVWSADVEYTALTLFPDFNKAGDDSVYYVDNLAINGATTPEIPVAPATVAPGMTKGATVSGTAKVGKSLTLAKGTWTGTPAPTYGYKWYRCTVSGSTAKTAAPTSALKCSVIAKATATTYKLVAADKGKYIRAMVTATNSKGAKYSLTKTTAKVS